MDIALFQIIESETGTLSAVSLVLLFPYALCLLRRYPKESVNS